MNDTFGSSIPQRKKVMYYEDKHNKIYNSDCRSMPELPDESVQCVVTSPPYWGLRKYSGEQELIWGDNQCKHEWNEVLDSGYALAHTHKTSELRAGFCHLCGVWKGAYGLEPGPEVYVQHTIEILREIRRVLRKDGVVFWNIGDSYMSSPSNQQGRGVGKSDAGARGAFENIGRQKRMPTASIKPKDLCLIPFRLALAAQEDGWWVRSVIIWSKTNPMPESVKDRPTESHEYILMLTKSKKYYWDADAVRMPIAESTIGRGEVDFGGAKGRDYQPTADDPNYRGGSEQWGRTYKYNGGGRNIRTVWEFPTQPYPEAHFAVFPEKLPELCIKAATPEVGCCSKCGVPWTRVIKKGFTDHSGETKSTYPEGTTAKRLAKLRQAARGEGKEYQNTSETVGWQPTCKCNASRIPSLVLDPLAGAGTTLWVAKKLNRRAVGYEISEEYCQLAVNRCQQQVLL